MSARTPSYRLHKPSGQAVVTMSGKDFYLGKHGTPESRAEYDRLLAEWLAAGRQLPPVPHDSLRVPANFTVAEMILGYLRHAVGYYRKGGEPTGEVENIKLALRHLRRLYGHTPARDFGPRALTTLRQKIIETGVCRNVVNRRIRIVVRAFKWAVENELVPPSVHHGLRALSGLRKGRSDARESKPVKPVPDAFVDAVEPYLSPQVWAMVQLQRFSGMRPGEVCIMRTCDLDTSGRTWIYTPATHKTEHHGRDRYIYLGPCARAVLRPWLRTDVAAYLFQPCEVIKAVMAERRRNRRTPMTPSQRARARKAKPKKVPGERYDTRAYYHAIRNACRRAGVPHWHPNQLRHNAATRYRKEFGLDVARVILGHSSPAVTEVYAEVDRDKALSVMERVG